MMKKISNKKIITLVIVSVVFFTAIIYILLNGIDLKNLLSDVNSASYLKTADWSTAKNIDAGYSHSTIFLSKDTKFSVYAFGQKYSLDNTNDYDMGKTDDDGLPYYEQTIKIPQPLKNDTTYDTEGANIKIYWKRYNGIYFPKVYINCPDKKKGLKTFTFPGFGFLIENAGIDNNGEIYDAYLKVGTVSFYMRNSLDYKSWVSVLPYYCIDDENATIYPDSCTQQQIQYGEPLNFEMAVSGGASSTELTYYKKGTFKYTQNENSNFDYNVNESTAAIDKIGGLFSDIDIYNHSTLNEGEVNGHEAVGFRGLRGATIYYDTEGELPIPDNDNREENRTKTIPYIGAKLAYNNGIIYINQRPFNVQNLRKSTSAYALETSGASSYSFDYSAVSLVHIYFSYLSPFKYKLEAPKKKVSASEVTDNTSYNYLISQYIPNNSTNKLQKFIQSTNDTSLFYDSITMSDTFDDNLTFNLSDISIKKEDNTDVTSCFSLSKSGNTVTAVINKTAPSSCSSNLTTQVSDFYNHTYVMNVPVTTKAGINKNVIKNTSKTIGVGSDNTEEELTSNTTETKVYYNVIENYKDMDGNVISDSVTNRVYRGENFTSDKINITGYTYNHVISDFDSNDNTVTSGVITKNVNITYYYDKLAKITSNYYVCNNYNDLNLCNKNENKIIDSVTETKKFGDSYNIDNIRNTQETKNDDAFLKYDNIGVITVPSISPIGTITSSTVDNNNNITINFYYRKKSNITIKYYDIETKKEIAKENVDNKVHYGNIYNVEAKKLETEKEEIFKNYNFEKYESNSKQSNDLKQIKIDNENVTVDLYYRLKTSTITIKYLEEATNKELAETYTKSMKYTEVYNATEIRDKAGVPKNYNLVRHESSTGVLSGTISEPSVLIIFYYEKKDPKLETNVSKTGTKEITRKDAEVGYKLNYKAVIRDYIGDAKVTYIDKLPYEIDEEKSDISGGKYNKESKTIIWEETYEKIDMEKEITFTKEINVVYIGIEDTDRIMTNEIETTIKLDNKESIVTSDYDTDIKIPGEIVIHYYDKETKEKLTKDIEKTDLIGNQYVSEEKEFEGYKLVSKPESNVHIYKEKKQEFSYEYEKIKFKITTKVEGEGGTIEGDEIVKYGEDSSKDKIKIKAKEGYEINKITINGESYEITDRNEIIMPYFKEVKEDKEIIVSFVKKIENPKTLDNIMSYIGYAVLSIIGLVISGIVLIKNKTQEKI